MQDTKSKLTIFFGDVDESLANNAKLFDSSAGLVDHSNYKEFLISDRDRDTVIFTSLGDLPKNLETVYHILMQADHVVYCPPQKWSDNKSVDCANPVASLQGSTEILLSLLPDSVKIDNYCPTMLDINALVDQRKSTEPQLWMAGCSITHGLGVEKHQRYGQLVSDSLGMPCSFLTRPGAAIDWAADQILRSDIQKNDIVVWGITTPERLTYIHNDQLLSGVTSQSFRSFPEYSKIIDPVELGSQNTIYKHFYAIQQVINYCRKINAHLILVGLLTGNHSLQRALKSYQNYITIHYHYTFENSSININFADLGSDNNHPGPIQHQQYKQIILDKIKQLKIV
jgi:hypothetical protein